MFNRRWKFEKIIIYGHGGAYNHGAEAITKCTISYLRKKYPGIPVWLSTHFREQDEEFGIPADRFLERDMKYVLLDKALPDGKKGIYDKEIYRETLDAIDGDTLLYSVGGDNYCYGNWHRWKAIHDAALENGARDVLWCCSIDKDVLTDGLVSHLKTFDRIAAREGITLRLLKERGVGNVEYRRDIAFELQPEKTGLPEHFLPHGSVALNLSPLILRREIRPGIVLENCRRLTDYILSETDMSILLIPHVRMPMDDDRAVLSLLYEEYRHTDRVALPGQHLSAAQCKYLISLCRYGVFARTHASIAAYSAGVPCIVIGYSVKSAGIAEDLGMGDYLLPVERIDKEGMLLERFLELSGRPDSMD